MPRRPRLSIDYDVSFEVGQDGTVYVTESWDKSDGSGGGPPSQTLPRFPPATLGTWHHATMDVAMALGSGTAAVSLDGTSAVVNIAPVYVNGTPRARVGAVYTFQTRATELRVDDFTAVAE